MRAVSAGGQFWEERGSLESIRLCGLESTAFTFPLRVNCARGGARAEFGDGGAGGRGASGSHSGLGRSPFSRLSARFSCASLPWDGRSPRPPVLHALHCPLAYRYACALSPQSLGSATISHFLCPNFPVRLSAPTCSQF